MFCKQKQTKELFILNSKEHHRTKYCLKWLALEFMMRHEQSFLANFGCLCEVKCASGQIDPQTSVPFHRNKHKRRVEVHLLARQNYS